MNIRPISDWTLYKHRFLVAYTSLAIILIALLALFPSQMPPGLSLSEQQSVVSSSSISFTELPSALQVIDLPYHILQKFTVQFFGVTPYGVRLPSLFFGAMAVLCLSFIIKRWFKTNIAIASSLLIITSCWFLTLARLGTPDIMTPFWTSLLVLSATYISQQTNRWHIWKAVFVVSAALSLYTPYMAYLFVAALIAAAAQPHLRYIIRQSSKFGITAGAFFFAILLAPLGWGIYKAPAILRQIFAVPGEIPGPLQFGQDLLQAVSNLVNPYNLTETQFIFPLISVCMLALVMCGFYRLFKDFHSVRAHVLLIWIALLVPIIGFYPSNLTVLFVPIMLIMAIGLNAVVRYWYRMFPANPYARIFGLAPLFLLVAVMVQYDYQRYAYNMLYSPQIGQVFNMDAFLLQNEINKLPASSSATIVAPQKDLALYQVIAERRPNTQAQLASQVSSVVGTYIVAESEVTNTSIGLSIPIKLIVNDRKDDSLRFRLYQ